MKTTKTIEWDEWCPEVQRLIEEDKDAIAGKAVYFDTESKCWKLSESPSSTTDDGWIPFEFTSEPTIIEYRSHVSGREYRLVDGEWKLINDDNNLSSDLSKRIKLYDKAIEGLLAMDELREMGLFVPLNEVDIGAYLLILKRRRKDVLDRIEDERDNN